MPRYTAKPRSYDVWFEAEDTFAPGLTVYDEDDEPTGIIDTAGNEFYRSRERCGFVWGDEE
jgi:hypothetical protein